MLDTTQGQRLIALTAKVIRGESGIHGAPGTIEHLGLIDHTWPAHFTEHALRIMCGVEENFERLRQLGRDRLPGAVVITTGSSTIIAGKGNLGALAAGTGGTVAKYIGFGQGTAAGGTRVTALTSDLGLCSEIVVNSGQTQRVTGTVTNTTTTNDQDTKQTVGTITAGQSLAIVEAGLFTTVAWPGQFSVATVSGTFLSGTTTSGGTATASTSSGIPTAATNYQVDQEIITCSLSGTTVTCTARGVNGSTAASHSNGCVFNVAAPSGTGAGGYLECKGDFAVISLASTDTLQLTATEQLT